jgi:predicted porin
MDGGFVTSEARGIKGAGFVSNLTATSGWSMLGTSDLGGGMTSFFKYGTDASAMNSNGGSAGTGTNNFGTGEVKFGLKGGFGEVALGAANDLGLQSHLTGTSFGTAVGSGTSVTSRMNAANKARNDNTVRYDSPTFSGFGVSYVGRKQQANGSSVLGLAADTAAQAGVSQIGLTYAAGPLNAILSRVTQNGLNVGASKDTITNIVANYTFGAFTVYGAMQGSNVTSAVATTSDRSALTFGGKYVMGANTFMLTSGRVSENLEGHANKGKSSKNLGLGYEYALSKTTSMTARYQRMSDDLGFVATAPLGGTQSGNDVSRMGVGLRVAF